MKVVVTGASGKTGQIVVRKLLAASVDVRPVVRSEASKAKLKAAVPAVDPANVEVVESFEKASLVPAFQGCTHLVILTSSQPKLVVSSLLTVMWGKLMGKKGVRPSFYFAEGQEPERVDWIGQREQIDAAKAAGIDHVILISSMGGTDVDHFLNTMGNGRILLWKRKAEKYLMASGLKYTIIHPGGLLPHPGPKRESCEGGKRELVVGVDDEHLNADDRTIPREDLAEVTVQCLTCDLCVNTSFDLVSKKEGQGVVFSTLAKLLQSAKSLHCDFSKPDLDSLLAA